MLKSNIVRVFNGLARHCRHLYVQAEQTPNPNSLRFLPGKTVLPRTEAASNAHDVTVQFDNREEAIKKSSFVSRLFSVDGVQSVLLGHDFVTITKHNDADWKLMNPEIYSIFMNFFTNVNQESILKPIECDEGVAGGVNAEEAEVIHRIQDLLNTRIRPMIQRDGGDVQFIHFKTGVATLRMKGACVGCPSAGITLKLGIENMLKYYIPEIREVKQEEDPLQEQADREFDRFESHLRHRKPPE